MKETEPTKVSEATRTAEREEAGARHVPDRAPTLKEEQAAEDLTVDEQVAEHHQEMTERGADMRGEGQIP